MLRCEHCKVYLPDNPKRCPLCGNPVSGTSDSVSSFFPVFHENIRPFRKKLMRWVAFISICVAAICVSVNLILLNSSLWSIFIIAGIASFWLDFIILTKRYKNSIKNILWQTVSVSAIALIWDIATKFHGWSIDFVFPILCICSMISIFLYAYLRKLLINDYIYYIIINCVLSVMSLVISTVMSRKIVIPSVISFIFSIISILVLMFFHGKTLLSEIQRRTHL